jgi:hypothetical protein
VAEVLETYLSLHGLNLQDYAMTLLKKGCPLALSGERMSEMHFLDGFIPDLSPLEDQSGAPCSGTLTEW